jgi:hypothetical protein
MPNDHLLRQLIGFSLFGDLLSNLFVDSDAENRVIDHLKESRLIGHVRVVGLIDHHLAMNDDESGFSLVL